MLILASKSAARTALLAGAGLKFESRPAPIDERALEASLLGKSLPDTARRLAEAKALAVSALDPDALVIGADQVLDAGGSQLHKPADFAEARRQLLELRGAVHHLHSGVALARAGRVLWSLVDSATLAMRDFDDVDLESVLAAEGEQLLASVGSYRLEGVSITLFERIEGDYFTILGLPLLPLLPLLAALRLHAPRERFT